MVKKLLGLRGSALVLSVFVVTGACGLGAQKSAARMQLSMVAGKATVLRDGRSIVVSRDAGIEVGDSLELAKGSVGELRLAAGRDFELSGAKVQVLNSSSLSLHRGRLLADVTRRALIDSQTVDVSSSKGSFRVDRELATRVGVYSGAARLVTNGEALSVQRYRQAIIAGGILPRISRPLILDPKDLWDLRLMQSALDLDKRLAAFARGLEAQLGPGGGLAFFQQVLAAGLDVDFLNSYTGDRRADVLIALAMSSEARAQAGGFGDRFAAVFDLWKQGASWGIVALEFDVAQEGIFARLLQAIERAGLRFIGVEGPGIGRRRPSPVRISPSPTKRGPSPSPSPTTITDPPSPSSPILPTVVSTLAPGEAKVLEELLKQYLPPPS
ncbi:MAG: hypothetical protein ABIS18_05215 [Actinomycetota bacterium]